MVLREMLVDDLDQVMKIETELFSPPWTREGFSPTLPAGMLCSWWWKKREKSWPTVD